MKNAVHGSSTVEKAEKVIKEFFPEVEILPDGTVKGLSLLFITSCASCVPSVFLWDTKNAIIHPHDHSTKDSYFFVQIYLMFLKFFYAVKQT